MKSKKNSNNYKVDDSATVDTTQSTAASPYWRPSYDHVEPAEGFSPFVAFCFAINYILGTGFLTIPWAFVRGGLFLSTLALVGMGLVSDVVKDYLLETMARAEAMLDSRLHWRTPSQLAISKSPVLAKIAQRAQAQQQQQQQQHLHGDEESNPLVPMAAIQYQTMSKKLPSSALSLPSTPVTSQPGSPNSSQHGGGASISTGGRRFPNNSNNKGGYVVHDRKFEVNALCRVFLGKPALATYSTALCLYIYCSLWAYACVFCSALSKVLPLIQQHDADESWLFLMNYIMYAVVFAAMVVPLSCLELDEQVGVQVVMTLCRFIMLFFMWTTCTTLAEDMQMTTADNSSPTVPTSVTAAPLVNLAGLPQMLPICVFAHIFHHSLPGLSHPVAKKRNLGSIFRATVVFATLAYSLLGWRLGSVLGTSIEQSANLNWKDYRGGYPLPSSPDDRDKLPWWVKAIAVYVVCFPALDVLSAFPLNAITLGNNLLGAVYGKEVHKAEVRVEEKGRNFTSVCWRIPSSV